MTKRILQIFHKNALTITFMVTLHTSLLGQTYFSEDFNYNSFSELTKAYENESNQNRWSTQHANNNVDINEDGVISKEEQFKKTTIVKDPFDSTNSVLRFELNKVSPLFFAQFACDDRENNNVIPKASIESNYNIDKDLYCSDCSISPLRRSFYEYKTHMNRNELAIYGKKRKMYKAKRDHYFGMKMLVDESYEFESENSGEIVTQFHIRGKKVINPPVALLIVKDRFRLALIKNNDGKSEVFDLGPVEKGKWVDWQYHISLSKKDKKGHIEVWRDGEKMTDIRGKNVFKNYRMYFKFGLYKWGWWDCNAPLSMTKKKIISFDKVWAGSKQRNFVF